MSYETKPVSIFNIGSSKPSSSDRCQTKPLSKNTKKKDAKEKSRKTLSKSPQSSKSVLFSHMNILQKQRCTEKKDENNFIQVSHLNDYDLNQIHNLIMRKLQQKEYKIEKWNSELEELYENIKHPQRLIERKNMLDRIQKLQDKIQKVQNKKHIQEYLEKAEPLLEEYNSYFSKDCHLNFLEDRKVKEILKPEEEENPNYWKKIRLVKRYAELASRYVDVQIIQKKKNVHRCVCGYDLSETFIDNLGIQTCPSCFTERYIIGYTIGRSESLMEKEGYDDESNFEKALMRFQGKQEDKIPETLFKELDTYFSSRGLLTSEEIKSQPINDRGKKDGTSLEILYKALQETDNSSFYEDANLIAHKYWGWRLPDVSHLECVIMKDYRKTQRVYNSVKKERSSSLGTQYRLFKHLELRGHPCSIRDFKIVKMRKSLEYHDDIWKEMCEKCGDPEIIFIETL